MTAHWDHLWVNLRLATMAPGGAPYGAIADGALAIAGDRIEFVGRRDALPGPPDRLAAAIHDGGGRRVTPGLLDCHTHLVLAGARARQVELRPGGSSDAAIA